MAYLLNVCCSWLVCSYLLLHLLPSVNAFISSVYLKLEVSFRCFYERFGKFLMCYHV